MRSVQSMSVRAFVALVLGACAVSPRISLADDATDGSIDEVRITADRLQVLPTQAVESVFGFGKNAYETPRALTSISNEMLDRVIITEIDDLVALTPGSFTQSFFGVAGSLDVRGTPGENYFRGMKRIDNPGNYPQAIGASDRIDVVRGPASPIYGPSKIGGYLNFVPKSARAESGQAMQEAQGEIGLTTGSWNKKVLTAEVGGPGSIGSKSLGYYLYGEFENSGSYYDNTSTLNAIYQASFNLQFSDTVRTEFGGMYQDFKGNQVAGWNRLTQDLVDHGTYVSGSPKSLDVNGDGLLSPGDIAASNANLNPFIFSPKTSTAASNTSKLTPEMALLNPGTAHLRGNQVLVQEDDTLEDQVLTLYHDVIYEPASGMKITNKTFFESLDNVNENAYGFSQMAKTWVVEDQLVFAFSLTPKDGPIVANFQASPSIRHQDYEHGDNFDFEYFDRRDLSAGPLGTPVDRRTMATRGQELYSNHTKGDFTDYGGAVLGDITFWEKLNLLAGARYDYIEVTSTSQPDSLTNPGQSASDETGKLSWSASLSYELPGGIRPYATIARQSTLIVGQGGQVDESVVASGNTVANSSLNEYGIKASLLDHQLYLAADYFRQSRLDYNAQDTVTNNTTLAKGYEFEARWVVNPVVTFTAAATNLTVTNVSALNGGTQFSFAGAGDMPGVNPALFYGGAVPSLVLVPNVTKARKAGLPENVYSLYGLFSFPGALDGMTASIGATRVSSVWSGFAQSVRLPSYTLLNAGIHYETERFKVGLQGKNLTNERYFRSNFPDLFGDSVVLPETPRNYVLSASFKF